jgi:hypothetical protein
MEKRVNWVVTAIAAVIGFCIGVLGALSGLYVGSHLGQ